MSKKRMNGREVLEEALRQCCADYCEEIPCSEEDMDLGEDYEKYMNSLIRRSKKPFRRCFDTAGKRAAGIAAAFLVMIGCTMSVSAVRKPIVGFLTNTYDKYVELFFDENDVEKAPTKIETVYTLGAVPEGYVQESTFLNEVRSSITWINDKNHQIILTQTVLDGNITVDNEHNELETVEMNGMTVIYIVTQHYRCYFWNDNEYQFSLDLSTEISHEMALNMIGSMVKFN